MDKSRKRLRNGCLVSLAAGFSAYVVWVELKKRPISGVLLRDQVHHEIAGCNRRVFRWLAFTGAGR